ncbi:MAG: hypothetical protein J0M34_02890 [Alphaproteobacteria bacterium]|nr:hypothetical protein [Alphaproteobacteria bacterium]
MINLSSILPPLTPKTYPKVGLCIYCDSTLNLTDEHIIPYGIGGTWKIPDASCKSCAKITTSFERTCQRIILGPLRMYYDMPTRRPQERPETLPLKVKLTSESDWSYIPIERESYPFLVLFPHYDLPLVLSDLPQEGRLDSATKKFWIRGAFFERDMNRYLQGVVDRFKIAAVMPEAKFQTHEFSLLLSKIAHCFACAELGLNGFKPFLKKIITNQDTTKSKLYVGDLTKAEAPQQSMHEVSFYSEHTNRPDLIVVRIRLFAKLETPTYFVVVGEK